MEANKKLTPSKSRAEEQCEVEGETEEIGKGENKGWLVPAHIYDEQIKTVVTQGLNTIIEEAEGRILYVPQ
jgi:hypothetical protein